MSIKSRLLNLLDVRAPRRKCVLEGKSKTLYEGPDPDSYIMFFKDDLEINEQITTIPGKGVLCNRISELLMSRLNDLGIETHFHRSLNMREQVVRVADPTPFSVTIHNFATGSFAKRLGLDEGLSLPKAIPEFSLSVRGLSNPVLAAEHLMGLGWSREDEIEDVLSICQRVNDFMMGQFLALNLRLNNIRLKFGRCHYGDYMESQLILIDAMTPETFSVSDVHSGQGFDINSIQDEPENATESYLEIAHRLGVHVKE